MTEQPPSAIGTVAQEAARLIEDMAAMARSSYSSADDSRPSAGEAPQGPAGPADAPTDRPGEDHDAGTNQPTDPGMATPGSTDEPPAGACSECGAQRAGTPQSCQLCPLCRGVALLRCVRPETVDMLADLALSLAASLRDMAMRTRANDQAAPRAGGAAADADRAPVQDIPVDDESE